MAKKKEEKKNAYRSVLQQQGQREIPYHRKPAVAKSQSGAKKWWNQSPAKKCVAGEGTPGGDSDTVRQSSVP